MDVASGKEPSRYEWPATRRGPQPVPLEERIWSKVDVRGPEECWAWKGALIGGRGAILSDGKLRGAHRLVFELMGGAIGPGRRVRHRCENRLCVNPAHLYLAHPKVPQPGSGRRGRPPRPAIISTEELQALIERLGGGRAAGRKVRVSHSYLSSCANSRRRISDEVVHRLREQVSREAASS